MTVSHTLTSLSKTLHSLKHDLTEAPSA